MAQRRPLVTAEGAISELPVGDTIASATIEQFNLMDCFPWTIGAAATTAVRTQTSTLHTATVARITPFVLPGELTLAVIRLQTVAAGTANLQLGIFDATGTSLWTSGNLNTIAGNTTATANLPVTLPAGQYYWATTVGTTAVNTTAAYQTTPAFAGAAMPRWGTVPATGGVMPASIDPTAVTETVGGFMLYALLSAWAT